jgi:hypothetical protein
VTLFRSGKLAVIDTAARTLAGIIDLGWPHPFGVSYVTGSNRAWVAHAQLDGEHSFMAEIDTAARTVAARTFIVSTNPKFLGQISGDPIRFRRAATCFYEAISLSRRGRQSGFLWVPVQYQNFHTDVFTPNSSINAAVHKVNLSTKQFEGNSRIVFSAVYAHNNSNTLLGNGWNAGVSGPVDIGFNATGTVAYVVHTYSNDVLVVPMNTSQNRPNGANPLVEINVGDHPIGIAISPTAERAYILNELSRDVSEINLTITPRSRELL